jgi:hypothetical protein
MIEAGERFRNERSACCLKERSGSLAIHLFRDVFGLANFGGKSKADSPACRTAAVGETYNTVGDRYQLLT